METPTPKPSRLKRIFRRTLFVLAALVTLAALFVAEEDWRGSRAWRNYKSDMEAKGDRFDAARLIPPKVPDDENFAACPYLAHAFAGPEGWTNLGSYLPIYNLPHRPGWPYGVSADLTICADAFQSGPPYSDPAPGRLSEAEVRQLRERRRLRYGGSLPKAENSQPQSQVGTAHEKMEPAQAAAIVLDHLKVCEPVLAELRAASGRRYCRFNVPYEDWAGPTKSNAWVLTLNHFVRIKGLFRVLSLRAEAELTAGQSEQALEDVNLMFRLDDGLKDEPLLMSQLVHYACLTVLLQPVAQGLAEHRWSDAQLRVLQERLAKTDLLTNTVQAFYGERDLCDNPYFNEPVMKLRGWDRLEQVNVNRAFQEALLPRINLADREINPAVGHACDLATSNYLVFPAVLQRVRAFIHHRIFAGMMLPGISRSPAKTAAVQTDVDLVRVACALERYRLAEGTYPDRLEALAPRFIANLPHDIINGQPLHYRRDANGKFVLYSVGWNEKDDGGVIALDKDGHLDRLRGDWVLEYPD
jgi:hypothetical protein